jgi:hypothetical protein
MNKVERLQLKIDEVSKCKDLSKYIIELIKAYNENDFSNSQYDLIISGNYNEDFIQIQLRCDNEIIENAYYDYEFYDDIERRIINSVNNCISKIKSKYLINEFTKIENESDYDLSMFAL